MRKRYLLLVLTVALGLSLLAVDRYTRDMTTTVTEQQVAEPDYYGEMLVSRRFGTDGELMDTFYAVSSVHYPQADSTVFKEPQLLVNQGNRWLMRADEGVMSGKKDTLLLSGSIILRPQENTSPWQMTTERLNYNLQSRLATSDDLVTITGENSIMSGTGMLFDADRQRLELTSGVRTRYVPE